MEHLPALGTAIVDTIRPTARIYEPLLQARADKILSTTKETFPYGLSPRQVLDVYYPSKETISSPPILLFFYGGGFIRGGRTLSDIKDGLVHANLGHFFSTLGYITIIPDYRLVPEAKFPSGGEDVLAALEWTTGRFTSKDHNIYLMGFSSGGVHVSTFLLADDFASKRSTFVRHVGGLRGAIFLSVPFSFYERKEMRTKPLLEYFGPDIHRYSPEELLKAMGQSGSIWPVPMLVLTCSLDPVADIISPSRAFSRLCEKLTSNDVSSSMFTARRIEGHNHISPIFAVGTGKENEEAWAVGVNEWMRSVAITKRLSVL